MPKYKIIEKVELLKIKPGMKSLIVEKEFLSEGKIIQFLESYKSQTSPLKKGRLDFSLFFMLLIRNSKMDDRFIGFSISLTSYFNFYIMACFLLL